MLPLREPPTTAHVFPRQNGLSNRTFVDPVTLFGPLMPAITSAFLKFFHLCNLRAGISAEGREKRETSLRIPKDFPPEQFPRVTAFAAARISNPHRGWPWEMVSLKPSRKKLK